jgi:crotonobetainyl-CoA:carnitine CoA-transferase CaiB-like acyl-CoA transferase
MILGDLGAEIIKIEPPEGESSRAVTGPFFKGETFFNLAFNRNKKSVTLDISTEAGKEAFLDLAKVSDIVVSNYRAEALDRAGISYDQLRKVNPRIIYCSIRGYGSSGPYGGRPAYDIVMLAESGALSVAGNPEERPARPGIPLADMAGSVFAAIGILAALRKREQTGKGSKIEVSLLGAIMSLLAYHFSYYWVSGIVPKPLDRSGHLMSVPYGIYKTKEGYLVLGACWPRITRVIGAEWLVEDPRFKDVHARVEHRVELNDIIEEHLAQAPAKDWVELCKEEDVPAGVVRTLDEVAVAPEVVAEKLILTMEHPLGGKIQLVGNPLKSGDISESAYTPPPTLGQHTHEILTGLLGYSEEKIRRLKKEEKRHASERASHISKLR